MEQTKKVLDEVLKEREYQTSKWNDDDNNSANEWIAFTTKYLGQSYTLPFNPENFRTMMLKTAALAVAAVEWTDRVKPVASRFDGVRGK